MIQKKSHHLDIWTSNSKIKFISVVFMMLIAVLLLPITAQADANSNTAIFEDVPISHQYRRDIIYLLSAEVLEENIRFRPDEELTAAEAIVMAEKLFGDGCCLPDWGWWTAQETGYKPWDNTWGFDTSLYSLRSANKKPASREFAAYVLLIGCI